MNSGLLLIEGDADTLESEGHSKFGDALSEFAAAHQGEGLRFKRVSLRSLDQFKMALSLAPLLRYPVVALVGHASPGGIVATPGVIVPWAQCAKALAPMQPHTVFAIACYAGMSPIAETFFGLIPTLEEFIGSPAPLSSTQALALSNLAVDSARGIKTPEGMWAGVTLVNTLLTKGVVFRRTRSGLANSSEFERLGGDMLAQLFHVMLHSDE